MKKKSLFGSQFFRSIFILSFFLSLSIFGQTPPTQLVKVDSSPVAIPQLKKSLTQSSLSSINSSQDADKNTEILILREQNKILKDFQSALLSTVFWALGGVFALVVLFGGLGWLTNFKLYETDKKQLEKNFDRRLEEFESDFSLAIEKNRSDIEKSTEDRSNIQIDRLTKENLLNRDAISKTDERVATLVANLTRTAELTTRLTEITQGAVFQAETDLRAVEEHIWEIKQSPSNILLTQVQGIRAALAANKTDSVKEICRRMKRTFDEYFVGKQRRLNSSFCDVLNAGLDSAMHVDSLQVAELKNLVMQFREN